MILKLRVPNYIEKHLIQTFEHNGDTLYADLTVYRQQFGYGDIPVYTLDEYQNAQFFEYFDGEKLSGIGF